MGYIGQAPANKAITSADIEDGIVIAADIADDAITLAKMASGTDGNVISYDASGNPVAIATGSDGEVLTSAGAGQPPAFESVSAGTALTGSTNNTITTVTGANAIQGESTLTYDGTQLVLTDGTEGTDNLLVKTTADGSISMAVEKSDMKFDIGLDYDNAGSQNFYIRERHQGGSNTNAVRLLIDSSGKVGIGETSPLGQLHIKSADSGGAAHANADELVIEGSGNSGMTIASGNSNNGSIFFSDDGDNNIGYIEYKHGTNAMTFGTNAANAINIDSTGAVTKPLQPSCLVGHNGTGLGNSTGDGTWKTLDFNTEIYDTNGDHSAGVFTAPVAGRYLSTITCSAQGVTSSENFMRLYCVASNRSDNNWSFHCDDMLWSSGGTAGIAINAVQIMDMDASDTLYWKVNFANGSKVVDIEDTILMSVECLG